MIVGWNYEGRVDATALQLLIFAVDKLNLNHFLLDGQNCMFGFFKVGIMHGLQQFKQNEEILESLEIYWEFHRK